VTVTFKSRVIKVVGPRGTLERSFKHIAVDIQHVSPTEIKVDLWFGDRKTIAAIRFVLAFHLPFSVY
jgi:large subunit ribosomal protein L9e